MWKNTYLFSIFILFFSIFHTNSAVSQVWTSTKVVGPFVCWGNFDLSKVEHELAALEEVHIQLSRSLKLPAIQEWIEVYVFDGTDSWKHFLRENYPHVSYRRALFIKKKGHRCQLFVCKTEDFLIDIRHEGTHALLDSSVSGVPEWLHEGLAEYFEVNPNVRLTGTEWFSATQRNARFGISRNLSSLEKITDGMSMTNKDYRDAWAWVNFLLNGPPEVRSVLAETIADYAKGDVKMPVSERIKTKIKNPDGALREFYRNLKKEK
ncbi:MAG: hypothetical protein Q4C96_11540 [Planctomycetia bacterium]|nr:hypothetical protein [Planctomycetia bacterium]